MDFPSITHLVSATFSEINSRGIAVSGGPGNAPQPISDDGGMAGGSDANADANLNREASDQNGHALDTKA